MQTIVVRVWLPDRPGALGQVASRIGALRGDVIGIDILERDGGRAVDDLTVELPDASSIDLLVREIGDVEDVSIEEVRIVEPDRVDPGTRALDLLVQIAETAEPRNLSTVCVGVRELFEASWAAATDERQHGDSKMVACCGDAPNAAWILAFIDGTKHLDESGRVEPTPKEMAWSNIGDSDRIIMVGRPDRPFLLRERQQLSLLCRAASTLVPRS